MIAVATPKQRPVSAHWRQPIGVEPRSATITAGTMRGRSRSSGTRSGDPAKARNPKTTAEPQPGGLPLRGTRLLLVSVPMVEFEKRIGNDGQTAVAPTAHELYRPCLLASCRNRPSIVVPPSVAVRAQKVALRGFGDEPFPGSVEVANPELLRLRVAVVKLQRGDAAVVAAVFTPAPSGLDEALLTFHPPSSLTAVRRFVPPLPAIGIRSRPGVDRSLGCVVTSKRRAG
jgi:hypothetical protein